MAFNAVLHNTKLGICFNFLYCDMICMHQKIIISYLVLIKLIYLFFFSKYQKGFQAVVQATKSSNELPLGDDYDYYSTFPAVREVLDIEGRRILTL